MSGQSFESALQECLVALDRGERLDFLLLRYPAHAEALRQTLELRGRLARQAIAVPTSMRARGEQHLRDALARPAPRGLGALPRVAVQALLGLAIVSGAVGASAAAGGPNLPAGVLQAVGLMSSDRIDSIDVPAPKSGRATDTPTATPQSGARRGEQSVAVSTPAAKDGDDSGARGLCAAYVGDGLGQQGRGNPEALARLLRAAGAESAASDEARNAAITAFCADLPARESSAPNATRTPDPQGAPTAAYGSPTPTRTPGANGQPTPERTPPGKAGPPSDRAPATPPAKGRN